MPDSGHGHLFIIDPASAITSAINYHWGTGVAVDGTEVNNPKPRNIHVSNDGAATIEYRLNGVTDGEGNTLPQFFLAAGENASHDIVSSSFQVESASGTVPFRAWATG